MRDPDIVSTSIETQKDVRHVGIDVCITALVRFWIGGTYTEKKVAVATVVDADLWETSVEFNNVVLKSALEKLSISIKEENERLQNLHPPKPVRKVSPRKEEAGELGGYGTAVPDILWGTVDDISTKYYSTRIGSVEGSPTLYVTSAINESYDDGRTGTSTGQRGRIQL